MSLPDFHQVVGVAGCGAMGLPMAKALQRQRFCVWGYDIRPPQEFSDFEDRMIIKPEEFANKCDVVISVVRDKQQTLDLCFDNQALFRFDNAPKTLIVSSTLSPRFIDELRQNLPAKVGLIDAPMSGAPIAAEQEALTFMLGGGEDILEPFTPLFSAMGKTIHHLGKLGAGMTFKVLNNFLAATNTVAVRRVLAEAPALGLDQDKLLEVMSTSSGGTWFGNNFHQIAWSKEGYSPENTIGILEKDMGAFLDALETGSTSFDEAVLEGLRKMKPY
ncbi:MAG: NAD(P)-dependent oxidoreductase [Rhodospirillales bacterium]|nr:NAD(P)-dependent oxidoreductase [Rhodospirillales bacterium]